MSALFVHLSDIHFGQERGSKLYVHDDVKEQLIRDAAQVVANMEPGRAAGILVTGDIAYSGKWPEYEQAGVWLDGVADAVKCERYAIQMVPGNHDINRDRTSGSLELMLGAIRNEGVPRLDSFLENERDRAALFDRFLDYGKFSEGYQCPLDPRAKYSTNLCVELAPARAIRFIRINSALLCYGKETSENPELIFGARQYVMPRTDGEEMIVLSHHPLHWFKDTPDALTYIRSRARVFMWGHEHVADVHVDKVCEGSDLLMLAAGATVPAASETYEYTYNIIEFDWDVDRDALVVTLYPRTWNAAATRFEADERRLATGENRFVLGSPNFRDCLVEKVAIDGAGKELATDAAPGSVEDGSAVRANKKENETAMPEEYSMVVLRFFRDLTEGERLKVLVELGAIEKLNDTMTQTVERMLLDHLVASGRLAELDSLITTLVAERAGDNAVE